LKPIVSQLIAEPPALLEEHPSIPSVNEVDELLVVCIGQMAVTAGTDLLWKPLNHEVISRTVFFSFFACICVNPLGWASIWMIIC